MAEERTMGLRERKKKEKKKYKNEEALEHEG